MTESHLEKYCLNWRRENWCQALAFSTSCSCGGEGVSISLMRFADGFKLRGIVNSRND